MKDIVKESAEAEIASREEFHTVFSAEFEAEGFRFDQETEERFYQFYADLVEKNRVMNLTGITDLRGVIRRHFLDSLTVVKAVPDIGEKNYSVIDMGTGAGFPGVPMIIAWPNLKMLLADSLNKRILFLQEEIEKLGLKNVQAVHGRAEELARKPEYREAFDLCVSRAVSNLSTLSEYCLPFIHINGLFIPYKTGKAEQEIKNSEKAVRILGGTISSVVKFEMSEDMGERSLVKIVKTAQTPKRYPRKAGQPQKEPIC